MSDFTTLDSRVAKLGASSRRAAFVSLSGFLVVLCAIGYAVIELRGLEDQRAVLEARNATLQGENSRLQADNLRELKQLQTTRAALSSARAAINAFHAGDLTQALNLYDEALKSDPGNAYLQNLRAYTLFRLGRVKEALVGESLSVTADPSYAWGYFDLARFQCAASPPEIEEARRAAAEALRLRPELLSIMRNDGEFQRVCRHRVP